MIEEPEQERTGNQVKPDAGDVVDQIQVQVREIPQIPALNKVGVAHHKERLRHQQQISKHQLWEALLNQQKGKARSSIKP